MGRSGRRFTESSLSTTICQTGWNFFAGTKIRWILCQISRFVIDTNIFGRLYPSDENETHGQPEGSTRTEDRGQSCEECRERNGHRRELWKKYNPHPLRHFEIFERHTRQN